MGRSGIAVVAYDAVGDEVPGSCRDIVHWQLNAERHHRKHSQVGSTLHGLVLNAPLAKDSGIDRLQKAESREESSPDSNIFNSRGALGRLNDIGIPESVKTPGGEFEDDLVRVRDPQHAA